MSKWHDQMFAQGSPEHDALMIKTVSPAGIKKIVEATNPYPTFKKYSATVNTCVLSDPPAYWTRGGHGIGINQGKNRKCSEYDCAEKERCVFLNNGGEPPVRETVPRIVRLALYEPTYQTEVIVSSGSFILGYIDAVITLGFTEEQYADRSGINQAYKPALINTAKNDVKILIEAKPALTSVGDAIRQLKTYARSYENIKYSGWNDEEYAATKMVLTTYTKASKDIIDFLGHEGITLVTFKKPASKERSSNGS